MIRSLLVGVAILLSACGPQTEAPAPVVPSGILSGASMGLDVTTSPQCVAPGEPIAATARTTAGAEVSFISTYPSGGSSERDSKKVTADRRGRATWEWPIPAQAKSGPAALITQATKGTKEARFVSPFRIDPACTR